ARRGVLYVRPGRSTTGIEQSLTDSIAAFALTDGKLRWVKQLKVMGQTGLSGFTSSPVLRTLASGNEVILAAQHSGVVCGLDPDHGGEILWQGRPGGADATADGGVAWGTAADHRSWFVALSGALAKTISSSGSLWALDPKTGTARWHTSSPAPTCTSSAAPGSHAQSQTVTVMPG